MNKNGSNTAKFSIGFGVVGFLAGVYLAITGETVIGIAGAIASAGLAYKGFIDLKKSKSE